MQSSSSLQSALLLGISRQQIRLLVPQGYTQGSFGRLLTTDKRAFSWRFSQPAKPTNESDVILLTYFTGHALPSARRPRTLRKTEKRVLGRRRKNCRNELLQLLEGGVRELLASFPFLVRKQSTSL